MANTNVRPIPWPRDPLPDDTPLRATGSTENEMPSAERGFRGRFGHS
jgi:hypothetical protein